MELDFQFSEKDCYIYGVDILTDSDKHCEPADNIQACKEQCQKEEHCKEFNFNTNSNDTNTQCCHIETRPEGNEKHVHGVISGPKNCGKGNIRSSIFNIY